MKHSLLVIGEELQTNELLLEYIFKSYKKSFFVLGDTYFSPKSNANLPFLIQKLSSENDYLTIFAHDESFTLVNKILSTLSEDTLALKDDMLIPSLVKEYEKSTYTLNLNSCNINVLLTKENKILPKILSKNPNKKSFIHAIGLDEESFNILLEPLKQNYGINTRITQIVQGWLQIEASAKEHGNVELFTKNVLEFFANKTFESQDIFSHIIERLKQNHKKITCAESCTGGLISSHITSISGSSEVYDGGLTTYANRIKSSWLGVDEGVLQKHGAVSEATVKEMLEGALKASGADFALATSGIAGPNGGTENKPVGTVFIGVANKEGNFLVERLLLEGNRGYIQTQSVYSVFKLLFDLAPEVFL